MKQAATCVHTQTRMRGPPTREETARDRPLPADWARPEGAVSKALYCNPLLQPSTATRYCLVTADAPPIEAVPSMPPSPMVSTAEEGTITIAPFSLMASYSMFMARRWSAVGLCW